MASTLIYKIMRLRETSSELATFGYRTPLVSETRYAPLICCSGEVTLTEPPCLAIFSLVQIPGYFIANLMNLENAEVLFCCIIHHTSYIIFFKTSQTMQIVQIYWVVVIVILSKYFVVFNHFKVKPILYYMYINHLLMQHNASQTKIPQK